MHAGHLLSYGGKGARSCGLRVCQGAPWQAPPCIPPAHGPWPPCPRGHVGLVHCVVGSVSTACPGPSHGCPGECSVVSRVAVGDGACSGRESGTPRRLRPEPGGQGQDRLWASPLLAPLTRGIFRREQAQAVPAFSWGIETGEGPNCRHQRGGHGAWHTAPSLEGLNHGGQTPRWHVIVPFLCETLEAFGVVVDRADVFWQDAVLRRCWTEHRREPPEMGRAPVRPAGRAALVSAQAGCEAQLGGLESAAGICTGPREVPHGFIFPCGARDCSESAGAREASQLPSIPAVRFAPSTGLFGHEGGRPPQQAEALCRSSRASP